MTSTELMRAALPAPCARHQCESALLGRLGSPSLGSNGLYDHNNSKPASYHPKPL